MFQTLSRALKTAPPEDAVRPSHDSLEDLLLEMARYGEPVLMLLSAGWTCSIDMNTTALGSSFKVRSEYRHQSPAAAAKECFERARKAVAALS